MNILNMVETSFIALEQTSEKLVLIELLSWSFRLNGGMIKAEENNRDYMNLVNALEECSEIKGLYDQAMIIAESIVDGFYY